MWIPAESHSEINSWKAKSSRRRRWDIGFVISQCQGPAARCHETNGSVYPSTRLQIWAKQPTEPQIPPPPPPQILNINKKIVFKKKKQKKKL